MPADPIPTAGPAPTGGSGAEAGGADAAGSDGVEPLAPGPDGAGSDGGGDPATPEAELDRLPDPVRDRLLHWSAGVLGGLPADQVPPALVRVARFTPAKRARTGAAALLTALRSDASFRAAVLQRWSDHAAALGSGQAPDPADQAALAVLRRRPDWPEWVDRVRTTMDAATATADADRLRAQVRRLTEQVADLTARLAEDRGRPDDRDEADRLRQRLREQGVRVRAAEQAVAESDRRHREALAALTAQLAAAEEAARTERDRAAAAQELADRTQQALAGLRESTTRARTASDRRLELLLQTVEGAAGGLRREWALQGGGQDPADALAAAWPDRGVTSESTADPARLQAWLGLPGVHLIVDGYNVSKTGFPEHTLAVQRDRVARGVGALGARTGAESTVVFDGGGVPVPPVVPQIPGRRTRILFSPPGVIADDVIVDLVAAEPTGRVVVVVTSDRDVVRRVGRHGARTAAAPVLLALLGG